MTKQLLYLCPKCNCSTGSEIIWIRPSFWRWWSPATWFIGHWENEKFTKKLREEENSNERRR